MLLDIERAEMYVSIPIFTAESSAVVLDSYCRQPPLCEQSSSLGVHSR